MINFHKIAKKWQKAWDKNKLFESDAIPGKKKFFITFPYPYMTGYLHVGHSYTSMRCEAFARYKRMQGYNVLFPQGFHATGSPIDTAAKRVKEWEQKQIETLKMLGFKDEEIIRFAEPRHWVDVFSKAAIKDFKEFGLSIDWRRRFVTTDLTPRYSKFIQWQFTKLKEAGYVTKGEHPVVWCPNENTPVGDHARAEGEGEMPEEMILIKFKMEDTILPAATYRPETTYGVVNMWLNPEIEYVEAEVDGEKWLVTEPTLRKLQDQKHKVNPLQKFIGKSLIGKTCTNPLTGTQLPILPAKFVDPENGTGVVMSVPSHAPYDWIALKEVQDNPEKFGVKPEIVKDVKPIALIKIKDYKEHPAIEIVQKMGIKSQLDEDKLVEATKEIYKKEFHTGILNEKTGKYKGMTVQQAKEPLTKEMISQNKALIFYELINPVVCRCLAKCHVKIVDDQWFIKYGDPEWKKTAMKAIEQVKFYPEKIRPQFEYVVDWLKDWACTREFGLGTHLPWDKKWLIESLSDSTIYMAYYTIAHLIKKVPISKVNNKLFDYIFLDKGNPDELKIDKKLLEQMKTEFNYWYPVDFRNSGKDLVQNHLTFYVFNHAAIFPEKHWPRGIGVNGFVNVEKIKMSKSKGNFKTLRELVAAYSPDITRIAVLSTGEELLDVSWEAEMAVNVKNKLENWYNFCIDNYGKGVNDYRDIDKWMESQLNLAIKEATAAMEETFFRTAIMKGFFDLQRNLKWYIRRSAGKFNSQLINKIIEAQTKMLVPFTPHICEEIWHKLEKPGFITNETWPDFDENKINPALDAAENAISTTLDDINQILKLAKIEKPKKATLFVAADWKYELFKILKDKLAKTRNTGEIIKEVMQTELKKYGQEITKIIPKIVTDPSKIPQVVMHQEAELKFLEDSLDFLKKEYGCEIQIIKEQDSKEAKAKQAMPGKAAILVE
ncbi:MAG: leucine--tRNA ligase [Candidatus Woesearchaeota archaeon]